MKQPIARLIVVLTFLAGLSSCVDPEPVEPDVDPRDKYLGTWNVQEKIGGQITGAYQSTVTYDASNTSRISIGNIYNLGSSASLKALVVGNALDMDSQVITGITIYGNGLFSNSGFSLTYTAIDGTDTQEVQATYSK